MKVEEKDKVFYFDVGKPYLKTQSVVAGKRGVKACQVSIPQTRDTTSFATPQRLTLVRSLAEDCNIEIWFKWIQGGGFYEG